jgi:intracellular multiplication protein IcmL
MKSFSNKAEQQKNYEYRDSFRWVLTGLVTMLIVCAILTAAVAYKAIFPGKIKYYASMTTGQVIPLPSLSEPVVTDKYLLEWASLATRAAFNLDFVNYQKQLQDASIYFTSRGWDGFSKALNDAGLLDTVKSKKLLMSAIIPKAPVIGFSGLINGRHVWKVTMPVLVTFGSASDERQRQITITMIVSRVPALETPEGIQITDFEAKSS